MADGNMKRLAAIALCDSSDPTRLTSRELNEGWGSPADFMLSYGLKPYNPEDCEEALSISRWVTYIMTTPNKASFSLISRNKLIFGCAMRTFSGG